MTLGYVIPVYNMADTIGVTLGSVLGQVPAPDGVVVVDDGSTDDTVDVARWFLQDLAMTGRILTLNGNRGTALAINAGVAACNTTWVQLVGADDFVAAGYARAMHVAMADVPEPVGVLSPRLEEFGARQGVWVGQVSGPESFRDHPPVPGTSAVRRTAFIEAGGMDHRFDATGGEDWDLWCELFRRGWGFRPVPDAIYHYRVRPGKNYDHPDAKARMRDLIAQKHPWARP